MLKRKVTTYIETHLTSNSDKILLIEGARQVGKSYAIRKAGKRLFDNYASTTATPHYPTLHHSTPYYTTATPY